MILTLSLSLSPLSPPLSVSLRLSSPYITTDNYEDKWRTRVSGELQESVGELSHTLGLMLRDELAALDEELGHLVSLMKVEGEALNSFDHMVEVAHVQVRISTSSLTYNLNALIFKFKRWHDSHSHLKCDIPG